MSRGCARVLVEGDLQVDLDLPAGDTHVVDYKAQQLLALLEAELVDADGCSAGEVADSLLEAVVERELLALVDELVALLGQRAVADVHVSCSPLNLAELEQTGLIQVGETSALGSIGVELAGQSIQFRAEQLIVG